MPELSRREFVKAGVVAGTGLTLAVSLQGCRSDPAPDAGNTAFAPDAWIRVGSDDVVTVMVDRSEMGQGVSTALPMLVAEELDADWATVRFEFAPANQAYYNPALMNQQMTGGSSSVRAAWRPLREAAGKARLMLVAAAAAEWKVPADECRTEAGAVVAPDGRRVRYGAIAAAAAAQPVPATIRLKDPARFRLIGTAVPRLDLRDKVTGRATFGIDAGPANALVAVVARSPVFGGTLRSVDDSPARAVPGVRDVVRISNGVAVVAEGYWPAQQGRNALKLAWDAGTMAQASDAGIAERLAALAGEAGHEARKQGRGAEALPGAAQHLEATYDLPYLAHATMEPMNCTADVREDAVTVWAPTQYQAGPRIYGGGARGIAARVAGVGLDRVTVHTTHLGGGFGRRLEIDYVGEACEVSKAVRAPVKVVWSREDDLRHDVYRPIARHTLRAGLTAQGLPVAWAHQVVSPSIIARFLPRWLPGFVAHLAGPLKGGVDQNAVEGAADVPYAIPNLEVRYVQADLGIPVGFWRSVGHSHTAFAVECFIDELAALAGQDPVEFRRGLLGGSPRHLGVLNLAAEKSGWGTPLPPGRFRGVAVHQSFGTWVAEVAEVSVADGAVRVHRVTCAVDCGQVVNPDTVMAQMEGSVVFGLTAALYGKVTIANGGVKQGNFGDYRLLSFREAPVVEVHLVPSHEAPAGVGEPGTPPIAPAVANAVFAATGTRIRRLPIAL